MGTDTLTSSWVPSVSMMTPSTRECDRTSSKSLRLLPGQQVPEDTPCPYGGAPEELPYSGCMVGVSPCSGVSETPRTAESSAARVSEETAVWTLGDDLILSQGETSREQTSPVVLEGDHPS